MGLHEPSIRGYPSALGHSGSRQIPSTAFGSGRAAAALRARMVRSFARAIDAAVLRTGCARPQKFFSKSCTRTMHTNCCIRIGEAMLPGKILYSLLFQINGAQDVRVRRFQPLENPLKAAAYLVLEVRGRLTGAFQLVFPGFKGPVLRGLASIAVNHSIA